MFRVAPLLRTCGLRVAGSRFYAVSANDNIRKVLTDELKSAMKSKDAARSMTIRSVLSEVYSADKMQPELLSSSAILAVIRKAVTRREDAALVYEKASRTDLAEKERKEVELLQAFIPPLLGEADIDRLLQEVISEQKLTVGDKKALGQVFKAFYTKVDKSSVDSKLVKSRADALFPSSS